jgi:hypothetical protein
MIRRDRASMRLRTNSLAVVKLVRGDKQCKANLIDFSPSNCAVRIHDQAFRTWTVEDLRSPISLTLHGDTREALIVRLQRARSPLTDNWIVGLVLR